MQRKGVRAVPRRATRQRVRTVTCVTVGTNVTLCVRTCACVGDRPAARPWPPPAVPPIVCPNAGAHTGTWHGSTSRASSAAFGPARNQPNASPGDHPGTRRCPLTDRSTCDGAFESRLLSQGKTRGLDGDHQGAGPFDQAVTARPSSVGRPSNCRQMHVPPAVRSSVSCPDIAGHCVFFSDGGSDEWRAIAAAIDANPVTVVRVRCGATGVHGHGWGFVSRGQRPTSRRGGYRGGNLKGPRHYGGCDARTWTQVQA